MIRDVDCQVSKGGDCLTDTADDGPAPQLTMMHPGTALQARMSDFHTVRVQVQGSATYHLLPPHASAQPLHLYPSIHRCAGQAQVCIASHVLYVLIWLLSMSIPARSIYSLSFIRTILYLFACTDKCIHRGRRNRAV